VGSYSQDGPSPLFRGNLPEFFFCKWPTDVSVGDLIGDESWFRVTFEKRSPELVVRLFRRFETFHLGIGCDRVAGVFTESAIDLPRGDMSPIEEHLQLTCSLTSNEVEGLP
jgi:hypothetical protein